MRRIATLAVTVAVMASCTVTTDDRMDSIRNDPDRRGSLSTPITHDDGTFSCTGSRVLAAEIDTNLYCVTPERAEWLDDYARNY